MPNYRVHVEGPAALALRVTTALADADGVDLTSSEQPVAIAEGIVALSVVVAGTFDDVADAVADLRDGLPPAASIEFSAA